MFFITALLLLFILTRVHKQSYTQTNKVCFTLASRTYFQIMINLIITLTKMNCTVSTLPKIGDRSECNLVLVIFILFLLPNNQYRWCNMYLKLTVIVSMLAAARTISSQSVYVSRAALVTGPDKDSLNYVYFIIFNLNILIRIQLLGPVQWANFLSIDFHYIKFKIILNPYSLCLTTSCLAPPYERSFTPLREST